MNYTIEQVQSILSTGQYGRLYITSKYRETFVIQILPAGEKAKANGDVNTCLNPDAVRVFEWRQGMNRAFRDGWLYAGRWQEDFESLVTDLLFKKKHEEQESKRREQEEARKEEDRVMRLLSTYG